MPDKLTDKEIVKALEICGTYKGKCTDCPAFVKVDRSNCKNVLLGAVEIINRQNADLIDKEKQLQDALKSMAVNKTKVIDCEKEINRLQAKNEELVGNTDKLKAENERLKPFEDKIAKFNSHIRVEDMLVFASSLEEWLEFCENLKAEAYKEFAETAIDRVEKAKAKYQRLCKEQGEEMEEHMHIHFNGITKIINNLLKEMVGEDDG